MKIVINYNRDLHVLDISEDATVFDIKIEIKNTIGIEIATEKQQLCYGTYHLRDSTKVKEFQMKELEQLVLFEFKFFRVKYKDKIYKLPMADRAIVRELQAMYEERFDVPGVDEAVWIYKGEEMHDGMILQRYQIDDSTPIYVYREFEIPLYGRHREYNLTVYEAMTIGYLKQRLAEKYDFVKANLDIKIHSQVTFLEDHKTLKDYGISANTDTIIYLYDDQNYYSN